jgi:hypothetical protein
MAFDEYSDEELMQVAGVGSQPTSSSSYSDDELLEIANAPKERSILSGAGRGAVRAAGAIVGTMNAPLAAVWGSLTPYDKPEEAEEFEKLSIPERMAIRVGSGLTSAWESATKKGTFGKGAGSYYESVTGQKPSPVYDVVFNTISDPVIIGGLAKGLARGGFETIKDVSKYLSTGKTPGSIEAFDAFETSLKANPQLLIDDINKLEGLDAVEKQAAQDKLLWLLGNRKSKAAWYESWGGKRLDELEAQEQAAQETLEAPGKRSQKITEGVEGEKPAIPVERQNILSTEDAVLKESIADARRIEQTELPETLSNNLAKEEIIGQRDISYPKMSAEKLKLLPIENQGGQRLKPQVSGEELFGGENVKLQYHSMVGGGSGIEQDTDGNFTIDPTKAIAGMVGGVAVGKYFTKNRKLISELSKTPELKAVYDMVGTEKSFSFSGLLPKVNEYLFNRYTLLKDVSRKAYDEAITFQSYKDVAWIKFSELKDTFKPVRDADDVMTMYIDAHRALSRAGNGIKNPNNVTLEQAQKAITQAEDLYKSRGGNVKELKEAFDGFQNWTRKYILQEARDSGIISKEAYDNIIKRNQFYATFDVLDKMPDDLSKLHTGAGEWFSVGQQNVIKTMTGTEKKIADPIEATIRKFTQAQSTFAKNRVASALIDDPNAQKYLRPVVASQKEFAIMENMGLNPVMEGSWSLKESDTINRLKNGRVEKYLAPKEIADTMKRLSPAQAPKAIQAINDIFRKAATTLYLPFTISNAMRDALMAYTTSPVYEGLSGMAKFGKDWGKGLKEGFMYEFLGKSDLVEQYLKAGGGFGYSGEVNNVKLARKELFKNKIDIVKDSLNLFKWIEKISGTIELAPRLGVYTRAFDDFGTSAKEAAHLARSSTIDFSKGGVATKALNQWTPFINARVQGWNNVRLALQKNTAQTAVKMFNAVVLPGVATYAYNRYYHSDLYDDIPRYIRDNYFTMITGTATDKNGKTVPDYFVIPKGDVGQLVMNPIEYALDQSMKKDRDGFGKFIVGWISDLSPIPIAREGELSGGKALGSITPPVIKAVAEDIAGKNLYTGKDIVPYSMTKKPPELQYKDETPESYKYLGEKTGVSPLRIQNVAQNILAGYGKEGLSPEAMVKGLTGRFRKTTGGEKEGKAWDVIKSIDKDYNVVRSRSQDLIDKGFEQEAEIMMSNWNENIDDKLSDLGKHGFEDEGGLRREFTFSGKKMRNILTGKELEKGVENKLTLRKAYKYK